MELFRSKPSNSTLFSSNLLNANFNIAEPFLGGDDGFPSEDLKNVEYKRLCDDCKQSKVLYSQKFILEVLSFDLSNDFSIKNKQNLTPYIKITYAGFETLKSKVLSKGQTEWNQSFDPIPLFPFARLELELFDRAQIGSKLIENYLNFSSFDFFFLFRNLSEICI